MHDPNANAETPAWPVLAPPGYEILCDVGHGGMGVVYRARHVALDRPVALKFLHQTTTHPAAVARFTYEARITARLQHPGIPPVYEVGTLGDGRPFLAMKLIEGRTLAELLRDQGPHPTRWLATFEAICQAVGYAHSQGIIHRDLKPANVMVGAFGEVQVMDWGLAKTLSERRAATAEAIWVEPPAVEGDAPATVAPVADSGRTPGTDETRHGSFLGTPAYVAPEQAVGAIDRLDRRSDAFGLGAILCALLTGQPPFVATDAESARQLAAHARLNDAFARLDACVADPEIVALAKRCLSPDPDQRPSDGGALAEAVAALRGAADDRARQAEMDRVRAEVQANEQAEARRRRRRLLAVAAGGLLLALAAGLAGTTAGLFSARRARGEEAEQRKVADDKRIESEQARGDAERARDLAKGRYELAVSAFHDLVFGIQSKLDDRPGTQELRKELLRGARQGLQRLLQEAGPQGADHALVWAHFRMGEVELLLGDTRAALAEYQTGHRLARLLAEARPDDAVARHDLSVSHVNLGDVCLELGRAEEALGHYERSLRADRAALSAAPDDGQAQRDLAVSCSKMGDACLRLGRTEDARAHFERALQAGQASAKADPKHPDSIRQRSHCRERLADVFLRLGRTDEALASAGQALADRLVAVEADPKSIIARRDLSVSYNQMGDVCQRLGRSEEALAYFQKTNQAHRTLAQANPDSAQARRDLSVSNVKLGDTCLLTGRAEEALVHFQKVHDAALAQAKADPDSAETRRGLALSYERLGDARLQLGRTQEALTDQQKALQMRAELAKADAKSAQARRDLSVSQIKVGEVCLRLGRVQEAFESCRKALDARAALAKADPEDAQARRDLSVSHERLGDVCLLMNQRDEALGHFQKARDARLILLQGDPTNADVRRSLSVSYERLGTACLRLGRVDEARTHYLKALDIRVALAKADPDSAQARGDLSVSHDRLAEVSLRLNRADDALTHSRKALELRADLVKAAPKSAAARREEAYSHSRVADVLLKMGRTKESMGHYRKSLDATQTLAKADPANALAQVDLFVCYWKLGWAEKAGHDYARAGEWFAKGRAVVAPLHEKKLLPPQSQNAVAGCDRQLTYCKNAAKAVANLSAVLAAQPADVPALLNVRLQALLYHKHTGEAIKTAECWADWAERLARDRDVQRYKAACALARCATEPPTKDALARKAAAVLQRARAAGYFDDAACVTRFETDADFVGVRDHPAFVAFAASLKK